MRISLMAAVLALLATSGRAAPHPVGRGVTPARLIAAARTAPVSAIDYDQPHCDADQTIDAWLKTLVGRQARAIRWSGGGCDLVNGLNPMDAGSQWCAQATITLIHPKSRDDRPEIEVYFEKPVNGRPGQPYAFRAAMVTVDGPDYIRARDDFEGDWLARFGPNPALCQDPN